MKKTLYAILCGATALSLAACSNGSSSNTDSKAAEASVSESRTAPSEQPIYKVAEYLDTQAYSRKGLIDQLVYLGYSKESAEAAVDEYGADWTEQAKRYLDEMAEPVEGDEAVEVLTSHGFTEEEAIAAAKAE